MKTKMSFRPIILACMMLVFGSLSAQVSVGANQGFFGDFVGWDNDPGNTFPLEIRHDLNEQIEWYTDAVQRMVLRETVPSEFIGTYSVDISGHLGIGKTVKPATYLHIKHSSSSDPTGFRPFMRTGLLAQDSTNTSTYFGIRKAATGPRSSILSWSSVPFTGHSTRFSFLGISARTGFFNNATGIFGINAVGPFSRLHLVDGIGQDEPIRMLNSTDLRRVS